MQILTTYNAIEFQTIIADTVKQAVQTEIAKTREQLPQHQKQFLTRQETAELLTISLVTLDSYIRAGFITSFRLGHKVRFKYGDVLNALTKINVGR